MKFNIAHKVIKMWTLCEITTHNIWTKKYLGMQNRNFSYIKNKPRKFFEYTK